MRNQSRAGAEVTRSRSHITFDAIKAEAIALAQECGYDPRRPLWGQRSFGWGGDDQILDIVREFHLVIRRDEPAWKFFWMMALARASTRDLISPSPWMAICRQIPA